MKMKIDRISSHATNEISISSRAPSDSKKARRRSSLYCTEYDFEQASERRKRQIKYSKELQASGKNTLSIQINSINRIVVQSFRKLIDCERCALFLMDHSTNELYFDPLGDEHDTNARQIRFPATTGVAGWVASHRKLVNIQNAYHDSRFNSEIDKKTKFRTRTILCAPVLSSDGVLFGVIQMVNKKKGDSKFIKSLAKKKKTDEKFHGYESCFEEFSKDDEETLQRCCLEVSKAFDSILARKRPIDDDKCDNVETGARRTSISSQRERRRSSLGNLFSFVASESAPLRTKHDSDRMIGRELSVAEALQRFQFRKSNGPQISVRGQLDDCPEHKLAISRRRRIDEYSNRRSSVTQSKPNLT
jgi:GAF domain-containing protein